MPKVSCVLALFSLLHVTDIQSQDTPLWRYTTTEKIRFFRLTPQGDLIVGTKEEVVVLDPETGDPKWTRSDILKPPGGLRVNDKINDVGADKLFPYPTQHYNPIPFTPYGVVRTNDGIVMIDLRTGETMWDSTAVPLEKVRGHFPVPQHDMVLVYGEAPESKRTFVAVDLATGEVRWQQDTLLRKSPNMPRAESVRSFVGHQPPLVDSDTTLILNVSKDGPMRIDSRSGELLWRLDLDKDAPHLRAGYAPMLYEDGVLFTPYEKKLMAVNTSDGSVIWDRKGGFRSRVTQMDLAAHGLVVRGQKPHNDPSQLGSDFFVDLLDPETGTSVWERDFKDLKVNAPFILDGDAIFIPDRKEFVALDYADGSALRLAEFEFEGGERPNMLEIAGTNFLISANQNFLSLDRGGTIRYHLYYESPGRSLLENIAVVASAAAAGYSVEEMAKLPDADLPDWVDGGTLRRFRSAENWANFAYAYTKQPDSSGREGFSLVRLDKRSGEEIGRVWIEKRRADYVIDRLSGIVFVKESNEEIFAVKFKDTP
jgi:outer membrane protein assembly factor BamB